ncbi:hypothetical protein D9615_002296 [Tricholomella constricta]|uniref:Impact N-terminal domain-containing protein n=1 Tax=Tricholomella constricta TaxID=117010 RepID=A0A8H5M9Y7_9AGAR|nr:hypothetical protein D9615_002296 [Tricholomella constricta]
MLPVRPWSRMVSTGILSQVYAGTSAWIRPTMLRGRPWTHMSHASMHKAAKSSDQWPHPLYVSDKIRDRKSTFLAHASTLPSPQAFPAFLDHLSSLSALKRATHCMYAYRITHPTLATGENDGGESGSGDRLARLLELSGCENVVVVVSRWYGGVKLGSDRWKCISDVAKDALDKGGFTKKRQECVIATATTTRKKRKRK